MRFLHTSDWHAGRIWKRVDRLDELRAALLTTVNYVQENDVDVVLMSGDIFDSRSPSGKAERLVAEIFRGYGAAGAKTVVIAGNHDSPHRLEAWRLLAELADVTIVPTPRAAEAGGVVEVKSRDGLETAVIACIPFASPSMFLTASELVADESSGFTRYATSFQNMVHVLRSSFRPDAVNILMAHTHLEGALLAQSERVVHIGEQWAAKVSSLPHDIHYAALGHIHKPQSVEAACPAYYAGSPMQLDFGEIGEKKTFNVFDARAGGAGPKPRLVPYQGARELKELEGTFREIVDAAPDYEEAWTRVTVQMEKAEPDIARKVREVLPRALVVHARFPKAEVEPSRTAGLTHAQMYQQWVKDRNHPYADEMLEAFDELYEEAGKL